MEYGSVPPGPIGVDDSLNERSKGALRQLCSLVPEWDHDIAKQSSITAPELVVIGEEVPSSELLAEERDQGLGKEQDVDALLGIRRGRDAVQLRPGPLVRCTSSV